MKTQEWTVYKKEEWPERGPWDSEPDKTQFMDEATGLPCLTVRNQLGAWCGYVGVSEGHPLYGIDYSKCTQGCYSDDYCYEHTPQAAVSVHGGITFSGFCDPTHSDEHPTVCHIPDPVETDKVWWLGFDTAHCYDVVPKMKLYIDSHATYRDLAYVQQECRSLAAQLAAIK